MEPSKFEIILEKIEKGQKLLFTEKLEMLRVYYGFDEEMLDRVTVELNTLVRKAIMERGELPGTVEEYIDEYVCGMPGVPFYSTESNLPPSLTIPIVVGFSLFVYFFVMEPIERVQIKEAIWEIIKYFFS